MKNKFLLLSLFVASFSYGQQTLFSYDPAGNQTNVFVEINFVKANKMAADSTLLNNPIYKDVKYFPNPVKNELYMEWEVKDDNTLSTITIFNLEGTLLKKHNDLTKVNNYMLTFDSYPQGIYLVTFLYSNGEQKTFKIIKQ